MGNKKKKLTFISIRRDEFVKFLLTGNRTSFPSHDEAGEIRHLDIKGISKYQVTEKDFSLETTVTYNGKTFPAKMAGRVSPLYASGRIEFYENTGDFE